MLSRKSSKRKFGNNSKYKEFSLISATSQRNMPSWAIKSYIRQKQKFFTESTTKSKHIKTPKHRRKPTRLEAYSRQITPKKKPKKTTYFKKPPLLPKRNLKPKTSSIPKKLLNDRYNVLKEIGKGASAIVYLIEDAKTKEQFAAKIFQMSDLALTEKFANLEVTSKKRLIPRMK